MQIDKIVTEQEALDQLRDDAQKSLQSNIKLLEWLDKKEEQWVGEFEQLSKEAQATDVNHYKLNYLIGLSVLIPVLNTFKDELRSGQTVDVNYDRPLFDNNDWGSNDEEIDDWLQH